MSARLHPYKNSLPQPEGSRWVWQLGGDNTNGKEYVAQDFIDLGENKFIRFAVKGMESLNTTWVNGLQPEIVYDNKKCHEAHSFTDKNGKTQKIFRLRESDVRLYFIYPPSPPDNGLAVIKISTKFKNKLTAGQLNELEHLAEAAIACEVFSHD
jgi:hypothetical protein